MKYEIIVDYDIPAAADYYSIVDTHYPHPPYFETVAECFTEEDAELVCKALNLMNNGIAVAQYHKYE